MNTCTSCKVKITNMTGAAKFKCPGCGKYDFIRCPSCRKTVVKYSCPECGFVGPN